MFLTPYVFDKKEITIKGYEYPNYTKNDIKKLENRIDNLEEFVTLSLLEKDAASFRVIDNDGFERTKTGLVVDNFNERNRTFLGDLAHPSYKCAIGDNVLKCRERRIPLQPYFDEGSDWLVTFHNRDGLLSLNYEEEEFINQPLSSFSMSTNPFGVTIYKGKVDLNIAKDNWVETIQAAAISTGQSRFVEENADNFIPQRNNLAQALRNRGQLDLTINMKGKNFISGRHQLGSAFKVSATDWCCYSKTRKFWIRVSTSQLGRAFLEKFGSTRSLSDAQITSWLDNEVSGGDVTETINRNTAILRQTRNFSIQRRTVSRETNVRRIAASINEENTEVVNTEVLERRQTRSEIPLIRSRGINFDAKGLKPNTRFYPFFDNMDISAHCIPMSRAYKISDISAYDANTKYTITLEKPAPFAGADGKESLCVISNLIVNMGEQEGTVAPNNVLADFSFTRISATSI